MLPALTGPAEAPATAGVLRGGRRGQRMGRPAVGAVHANSARGAAAQAGEGSGGGGGSSPHICPPVGATRLSLPPARPVHPVPTVPGFNGGGHGPASSAAGLTTGGGCTARVDAGGGQVSRQRAAAVIGVGVLLTEETRWAGGSVWLPAARPPGQRRGISGDGKRASRYRLIGRPDLSRRADTAASKGAWCRYLVAAGVLTFTQATARLRGRPPPSHRVWLGGGRGPLL